jgi:hypothetical protein
VKISNRFADLEKFVITIAAAAAAAAAVVVVVVVAVVWTSAGLGKVLECESFSWIVEVIMS